ncbi:MAG: YkvA family protein [Pseudomonadota bacterium]
MMNDDDLPPPHPGLFRGFLRGALERLLRLGYAAAAADTPRRLRVAALLAAVYVVFPFDLISDLLPLLGFGDDVLALSLLAFALSRHVTPEIRQRARARALRIVP